MSTPKCECCSEINDAIRKHQGAVFAIIRTEFSKTYVRDPWLMYSDAYEALWQALINFSPDKGYKLNGYICTMIKQRIIDGLRSREGRSDTVRAKKFIVNNTYPLEEAHDEATDFEWDPDSICFINNEIDRMLELAEKINPKFPRVLERRMEGYQLKEILPLEGMPESTYFGGLKKLRDEIRQKKILTST